MLFENEFKLKKYLTAATSYLHGVIHIQKELPTRQIISSMILFVKTEFAAMTLC